MGFPKTLIEFQDRYPDEESCWRELRQARWPAGFVCPRCGGHESSFIRTRRLEQCRRCRYQASVTAGTVFHKTRKPLRVWFLGIFFLARHKKGISALQFQKDAGIGNYQTAWTMLHKLRSALGRRSGERLSGLVEADEAYVGGPRPGVRGRGAANKSAVAVLVERRAHSAGAVHLAVVPNVAWESLGPFVRGAIDGRATTVLTDDWSGYWPLGAAGVDHRARVQRTGPRAAKILPWAHVVISNLKTWLRGTFHGVSPKHLHRYLAEFRYRFNRRWREVELFDFVLRRAVQGDPLPYRRLTAEAVG
ncbi:MAG: IS1595 family transposase [Gemmatimonadales bacterium]|nr:IS1595 family transposase [Gemmatimonadales bacterium]